MRRPLPAALPRASRLIPATALLLAAIACRHPSLGDLEKAARAMEKAAEAGGAVRAAALCAEAQGALAEAEAEIAVQTRRLPIARDYEKAETLALRAREAAERCALQATLMRSRSRARADRGLADLERGIGRAAPLARHLPDRHPARDTLRQAEIALGEGRESFARLEFERAEEAAARGARQVSGVVRAVDAFIESFAHHPRAGRWKRWVTETLRAGRGSGKPVILVDKLRRQLLVLKGDDEIATYSVELGISAIEDKIQAGDEATPEGRYHVTEVRDPGRTRYYRALMLDYPNADDLAEFRRLQRAGRVTKGNGVGSHIEIHGEGGRGLDWTQGCVALTNADMDDLVGLNGVGVGTPVTIVGTIPEGALP
jgi:hypothetical protein